MDFKKTHEYVTSRKFNPSKKMGQNFLINEELSKKIIDSLNLSNADLVIEIGSGLGALTDNLINKNFDLTLIELDKRLNEFLQKRYVKNNVKIINDDVLKVDLDFLTKGYKNPVIISNLPYSISSLVILKFLKTKDINTMYCMLQKEMAERISAPIKTKKYNSFTVMMSFYAKIKILYNISPKNFYPIPEIDSYFISVNKSNNKYDQQFDSFLRKSFTSRRKTLLNNLKSSYEAEKLKKILNKLDILLTVRPEELTSLDFLNIYKIISFK